jgi:hypothetical protein
MNGCHTQIVSMPVSRAVAPTVAWPPAGYAIAASLSATARNDEPTDEGCSCP